MIVVPEEKDAYAMQRILSTWFERVLVYPTRDFVFENITAYSHEWEHERLNVLKSVSDGLYDIVIAVPDALMQYTVPADRLQKNTIRLKLGDTLSTDELCRKLELMGYTRTEIVEGVGQFSLRGGIIDVFSPQYREPLRIDFFGDEVDLIGFFDTVDQRTIDNAVSAEIIPCAELLPDESSYLRLEKELASLLKGYAGEEKYRDQLKQEAEAVAYRQKMHYADRYYPLMYHAEYSLTDALGKDNLTLVMDSRRVIDRAKGYFNETAGVLTRLAEKRLCRLASGLPLMDDKLFSACLPGLTVLVDPFSHTGTFFGEGETFSIETRNAAGYGNRFDLLCEDVGALCDAKNEVLFLTSNDRSRSNLQSVLEQDNIRSYVYQNELHAGTVAIHVGDTELVPRGFLLPSACFAMLTDTSMGAENAPRRKKRPVSRKAERIASYADLTVGDLVVHVNHGIGKYMGIQTLTTDGVTKDCITLVYTDGKIYVPCNQLDLVSKYVGGDDHTKLSKLG
ncbi:MAG: hypothetical protein IJD82_07305, partial [Clostridia bacterium]|nr:hypothetical protein [Clostridia bacterium]